MLASIIYVTAMSSHPSLLDLLEQIIMSWLDVEKSQIKRGVSSQRHTNSFPLNSWFSDSLFIRMVVGHVLEMQS